MAAEQADQGSIVLGPTQYGKAEIRLVRVSRDTERHEIRDLNVSSVLRGRFQASHVIGDQSSQLPTDSQKNTVFAFAKQRGIGAIEDFAAALAEHFVDDIDAVTGSRIHIEEFGWDRIQSGGTGHDHSFVRSGRQVRTASVTVDGSGADRRSWVIAGVQDLVVLKTTASEYFGYVKDPYTTLPEAHDRILATSLVAQWRYGTTSGIDWDGVHAGVCATMLATFAEFHSLALQQSLWEMGKAALAAHPEIVEIRLVAPNRHHFTVDLTPFGLDNPNEVFFAADRPYGLIEANVLRDGAPDAGLAWQTGAAAG